MSREPDSVEFTSAVFMKVSSYCVNVDVPLWRTLRLLRTKSSALGIVERDRSLITPNLVHSPARVLLSIALKCIAAKMMKVFRVKDGLLRLPDCGQVAIHCFPGYTRVFDLEQSVITNVFGSLPRQIRCDLASLVDSQARLGEIDVAPKIISRERNLESYVEEYCEGKPLRSHEWWRKEVFQEVCAKARAIQRSANERSIAGGRIAEVISRSTDGLATGTPEIDDNLYAWLVNTAAAAGRRAGRIEELQLCLSHGDLARRNILVRTSGGVVFIDWQTVGFRVRDYDLYNYHFSLIEDNAVDEVGVDRIFGYLNEALHLEAQSIALERLEEFKPCFLATRLEHFAARARGDSVRTTKVLGQIREYFRIFGQYEQYCMSTLPADSH